ncbi:MAG: choice-of-anchor J domain-containing protein [Bacteroidota bacterium]
MYNASTTYNPYYLTTLDFTLGATTRQVRYYYWLGDNNTVTPLTLQISTNGGGTWNDLYAHPSPTYNTWTLNTVILTAYVNQTVKFRFKSVSNYGGSFCNQGIDEFVIENAPSCAPPSALTATSITMSGADMGWTSDATEWEYQVGLTGFTPAATGTATTLNPTHISGLTANTSYDFYVRSKCGALFSNWSGPKTFRTLCGATTIPFVENFDSYTPPAIGCGTIIDVNGDGIKWASSAGTAYNDPNKLHIGYSAAGVTQDDWYITQGITLTGGQSYDVKFYYKGGSSSYLESLEVKWGAAPTAAGMTSPAIFSDLSFYKAAYTLGVGSFVPSTSGTYYVGWHCISIGDQLSIDVDQITIDVTPACPPPTALTAINITGSAADIGWTSNATAWEYQVGLTGFTPSATGIATTTNPTHISGLASNTAYDFYVRTNCSGAFSDWSGPHTFSTLCSAVSTFPYTQSFAATFTDCWFASEETTGASIHWATTTGDGTYGVIGPQAGTHFAFLNVYDATTGYNPYYLTTLDFALGATPRQVKYYYWLGTSGYQTSPDPLTLQVSTDNGLNWTDLYAHNSTNSVFSTTNALTGWTLNTVLLSNYINQTVKFRFKSMSNYGSGFCDQGLDEFVVENAPPMGVLQGHVFDAGAEEPLFGATVSFGTFSTTSDGSGFYQFPYVPVGTYDVTCSKAGFQPITVTGLAVTVNHTTVHDFNMLYQLDPPEGLQAEVQSQYNVHLTWRAPGSQPDQWIHWDNGAYGNALGLTNPATWFVAQRFPVSDIAAFGGMHLKKIKFWPYDVRDTYTLKVWTGANAATEVASQLVLSPVIDAWNEITLTIPIVIDGTKELWIGYEIVQTTTSNWPAGMDTGPAIAGKGDWINYSGSWAEVAGFGFNNNWLLQGWVQNSAASGPLTQLVPDSKLAVMPVNTNGDLKLSSVNGGNQIDQIAYLGASLPAALNMQENNFRPEITAPDTPLSTWPVSGYNVYRNGTKINTALVPTLYYTNVGVAPGVHSYTVKAVYAMGESPNAAGPVEVTIYSCDVPKTLQVPNATLSTTTAKATWVASVNTPTPHWVIEYGLKGFIHGTGIVANVNLTPEYTMTPLLPGTEYDFYVRTLCNQGDSSAWIKKTFRTHYFACTQGSVAELEICGDTTNNGCNLVVPTFEPISCGVTICGTSWFNGAYRDTDWFTFTLAETKDVTLTATAEFAFLFGFIDSPCPAVAFKASNTGNAGATASVTLQLAAGTYYAFMAPQFVGHIVCDSINRYLLTMTCNTCLTPTALTAIGMTTTSAILEWTSTASLFNIEWGPAGFQKGQGTTVNNVTNPHTLSNLVGSTSYDYYVQANCGNTLSGWAGPYTFSTLCDVAPAPWAEGFEGSAFFPTCWSGSTVAPVWIRSIACGGYGTSTASAKANFYSISSTTPFDLISLEFNASALHLPLLKFDYAYMTYVGELDEMDVYYSTDAGVTFTLLLAMPGGYDGILNTCGGTGSSSAFTPTANQWATQSLALPAGTNMVKFQGISAWGNNLYLDNVRVEATPIPEFLNVQGTVTTTECYNATQTITVGGVAAPFIEEATGSVNFVAGHNIKFMPSTWIKNGAYMRAHITTTGTYCGDAAKTMVTKTVEVADAVPAMEPGSFFKVYPNPTNDKFYLEMDPTYLDSQVQVQIFGMVGGLIRKEELTGNNRYEFSLGGKPAGIYFIRVLVGDRLETKKIIKQ